MLRTGYAGWLESGEGPGGWFVATMARLLCPGSIAPLANRLSLWLEPRDANASSGNRTQRRTTIDRRIVLKEQRQREREGGPSGRDEKASSIIKLTAAYRVKIKVCTAMFLLSLCSATLVHAYRANSILSTSHGGKVLSGMVGSEESRVQ